MARSFSNCTDLPLQLIRRGMHTSRFFQILSAAMGPFMKGQHHLYLRNYKCCFMPWISCRIKNWGRISLSEIYVMKLSNWKPGQSHLTLSLPWEKLIIFKYATLYLYFLFQELFGTCHFVTYQNAAY